MNLTERERKEFLNLLHTLTKEQKDEYIRYLQRSEGGSPTMTTRTNTAKWTGTRWRIDVQKDGTRKSFYSSTPGRTGQREANAKADKWLQTGVTDTTMRVRQAYGLLRGMQHSKRRPARATAATSPRAGGAG